MLTTRPKLARRRLDGVLLLDKPAGLSSTQAMAAAKRVLRAEKAGHTGTLDPFATGLLPICFGEATKFSRFVLDADKRYTATLHLGATSSTGDTEGEISAQRNVSVNDDAIESVLQRFVGVQMQRPPMHSALKHGGVPLYKLARQGIDVPRAAREVHIRALEMVSHRGSELVIDTAVSKGTYIRVLAEEIGEALGCGAYLTALRRTATGGFDIANTVTLDNLASLAEGESESLLLPPEILCAGLPTHSLDAVDSRIFCNGGWLPAPSHVSVGDMCAILGADGRFLGMGEMQLHESSLRLTPARLMATAT
jgi:tRNA pseudouridine55 synthase